MTPPTFHIGDKVLITGPSIMDCKFHIGRRFTIEQIDRDKYSSYGLPYYPASSLQLVNKKPLSPMQVTYNYKPDDCEHGTFQVSCPCGRKAEIDPNWPKLDDELKIGDFVEIVGKSVAGYDDSGTIGKIGGHNSIFSEYQVGMGIYPAKSLRKLTPEEIKQHADKANTFTVKFKCDTSEFDKCLDKLANTLWKVRVDERLSAIEKQLKEFDGEISHLMGSIQECLMESGDVEARTQCREMAIEKRLDFVEKFQREQTRDALYKGWMAGP